MQLYPEVQSRAREEVIKTLDPMTRLPNPAEVMKLDCLGRVLREVLRWIPALALGKANFILKISVYVGMAEILCL